VDAAARLIAAYLESLAYSRDNNGVHDGSPYDMFLKLNGLPQAQNAGETDAQYTARLVHAVEDLKDPKFVDEDKQTTWFQYHRQKFNFGPEELAGLRIFLRTQAPASGTAEAHVANCTACHTPPDFTDRSFHNNGASQEEFDAIHGTGAFAKLAIPTYEERSRAPEKYLPATPQHPNASEIFRTAPSAENPRAADLGMWNIFANPDYPEPQAALRNLVCPGGCNPKDDLPRTIGLFRTLTLRDLEDSAPFLHTGRFATVEDMLHYYMRASDLERRGLLRNGAPELGGISIDEQDVAPLGAFLRSLNEDYD
jgi:cytochrome c peroxidase